MDNEPGRRRVLRAMGAGVAGVGLAGCSAVPGVCGTPGEDFEDALPTGGEFEQLDVTQIGTIGNIQGGVSAAYEGPDGDGYRVIINEYESESDAEAGLEDAGSTEVKVLGIVRVGPYLYGVRGREKGPAKNLLSSLGPLDRVCVERSVGWY